MAKKRKGIVISPEPGLRASAVKRDDFTYTPAEEKERQKVELLIKTRDQYGLDRKGKEREWTTSYKMYMSYVDTTRNPFMSNLFIPKVHEAVELLAAFLIGTNQSINTSPENTGDSYKALVAGKWLDFLWRKVLKARMKVLTWVKQGIVFGNGIMKVGWDADGQVPYMEPCAIEDVYFDYYVSHIQDSEYIFHEVRREKSKVLNDERYDLKDTSGLLLREQVIVGTAVPYPTDVKYKFEAYDRSLTQGVCQNKVPLLEGWCKTDNTIITLAPTAQGYRILRETDNPNYYSNGKTDGGKEEKIPFRPFAKLRFKTSPLPNRAYDLGAVFPTAKIQLAFNNLMNQYFDNVVMINNAMWIKRRGARVNPSELVRRPGGVISVSDIDKDIKSESVPDIKASVVEMLNRLDNEFQQASMVINLLKGLGGSADFAVEVQLGQQNVQTLLDMVDESIKEALSEVGDMVLNISLQNADGNQTVKMFETDDEVAVLEFTPENIIGRMDVRIAADRSAGQSKVVRQKQLMDFIKIAALPAVSQRYPNLMGKTLEKWLEEAGFQDTKFFFPEIEGGQAPATPALAAGAEEKPSPTPQSNQQLTETAALAAAAPAAVS